MFSKFLLVFTVKQDKVQVFTIFRYTVRYSPYLGTVPYSRKENRFVFEIFLNKRTRKKGYLGGAGVHDVNQTVNSLPSK
jgi:hypothetical protein